jgi:hypothetical protein
MKPSAFEMYPKRFADQLPPKAQQILGQLPDSVFNLAVDAGLAANHEISGNAKDRWALVCASARARLRHAVPALDNLPDEDLDIVIDVAIKAWSEVDLDRELGERKPRLEGRGAVANNTLSQLRLRSIMLQAWTEMLILLADLDSPAAVTIRNHIDALTGYHRRVLAEPHAEWDPEDIVERSLSATYYLMKAALPPEIISAVSSCVHDMWEQSVLRIQGLGAALGDRVLLPESRTQH